MSPPPSRNLISLLSAGARRVSRRIHLHCRCSAPRCAPVTGWMRWLLLYGRPQAAADFIVQVQHCTAITVGQEIPPPPPLFSNKSVISDDKRDPLQGKYYRKTTAWSQIFAFIHFV